MAGILSSDINLTFPDFTVVSASAGSGKTHTLTLRLLQLLLSGRIPRNRLKNILAMTFTKNAAAEMRRRVLGYLKLIYFGDEKTLSEIADVVALERDEIRSKAGELIEIIFSDYTSFQIQTIDSFISRVFKASGLVFGYSPSIDILLDSRPLLDAAFVNFVRELTLKPEKKKLLEQLTSQLADSFSQSRYIWNPFQKLSQEVIKLYETFGAQAKEVLLPEEDSSCLNRLQEELFKVFGEILALVRQSGLKTISNFEKAVEAVQARDIDKLVKSKSVKKPLKAGNNKEEKAAVEKLNSKLIPHLEQFYRIRDEFIRSSAEQYYRPSVEAHRLFKESIEQVIRRNNQICLSDVNQVLLSYISREIIPQLYIFLGDAIAHYLIDEFQDTSRAQWQVLKPLFEETLSKNGSLFIVGDTKQSIYTFRHADWHIMKEVRETTVFPSAPPQVKDLVCNYRSYERIVDFNRTVFHDIVPKHFNNKAPEESGLSNFKQEAEEKKRGKGYVEVSILESDINNTPERAKLLEVISDCRARGYKNSDIAILTQKNKDVIEISSWLNAARIPFISHSSLDIRSRRVTRDIFALLRFLDSPIDNLAFASFILSKTFSRILNKKPDLPDINKLHEFVMKARQKSESAPLYTFFRKQYPHIWRNYFEYLFSVVGYLPLYDLTTEILKRFDLFTVMNEEEETLAKMLGVIKNYEDRGQNNLKDFLAFTEKENEDNLWDFVLSRGADAVEVMTIHKAKGLGNRVVIVFLYDGRNIYTSQIIDEKEDGVRLLHITSEKAGMLDELQELYNRHRLKQDVDDLNKLYVAFTRAEEEMYIIDIRNETYPEPSIFLPQEGYEQTAKPVVEEKEAAVIIEAEKMFSAVSVALDSISTEKLSVYERQRGDCIHSILSQIEYIDDNFEEMLDILIKKEIVDRTMHDNIRQLKNALTAFLTVPEIKQWFNPKAGRIVLNEQEFVDDDGRLYRMDRIVMDTDRVTVIDYKTGDDKAGYTEQLEKYVSILRSCYKEKDISGILAFIDKRNTRIVI